VNQGRTIEANRGEHQIRLSFKGYAKGVYFVHFMADNIRSYATFRIVKQ